jgi:hypothetical protein
MLSAIRAIVLITGLLGGYVCAAGASALGGAFDDIPVGARARGMGGAYTAVCDDASGIYWNPSALGRMHKSELVLFNQDLYSLGLVNYSFVGFAYPHLGNGAMGFGWIRLGTSQSASIKDYAENTYIISYGQNFGRNSYVGLSIKYFSLDYDIKAAGYGADAALSCDVIPKRLSFALNWQNFNKPEIRWNSGAADDLDSVIHLGTALRLGSNHTFSADASQQYGHEAGYSLGWESMLFRKLVAVRAGGNALDGVLSPSFGIGVRYRSVKLDCTIEENANLGQSVLLGLSYTY